jgi:hypothetical protein
MSFRFFPFTSPLEQKYANQPELLRKYRRSILFSRILRIGIIVVIVHTLQDISDGLVTVPLMDLAFLVILLGCYFLNEYGKHNLAKVLMLLLMNTFMGIYASLIPRESGIYMFFFPLIAIASVVFEPGDQYRPLAFILYSVSIVVFLVATDFNVFPTLDIPHGNVRVSFIINATSSFVVTFLCIRSVIRIGQESEAQMEALTLEMARKNEELEKANVELDRFVYSTSHDLRAPLASLHGLIQVARLDPKNEPFQSYLQMMEDRTRKLDDFIREIISYARNARTPVDPENVDLKNLVFEILGNLSFLDGANLVRVDFRLDEARVVVADRMRLRAVLTNLIANAIKYHNYSADEPWISIETRRTKTGIAILIADNGSGISADHIGRVFDMFYRASEKSNGSGIGLYIVKEMVEKMKGKVEVASAFGKGSTFTVHLPAA